MNRNKLFLLFILSILLFSCQNGYKQHYETFEEFNKVNQRNKGWFPKIIFKDATELKNISYLDSLCAFGKFQYTNTEIYDSIFLIDSKIDYKYFRDKVIRNIKLKPNWFIDIGNLDKTNIELIKKDGFLILKNNETKSIYFILSN